jgi:hypothetical protein
MRGGDREVKSQNKRKEGEKNMTSVYSTNSKPVSVWFNLYIRLFEA